VVPSSSPVVGGHLTGGRWLRWRADWAAGWATDCGVRGGRGGGGRSRCQRRRECGMCWRHWWTPITHLCLERWRPTLTSRRAWDKSSLMFNLGHSAHVPHFAHLAFRLRLMPTLAMRECLARWLPTSTRTRAEELSNVQPWPSTHVAPSSLPSSPDPFPHIDAGRPGRPG
jgi:hypothetical protein